MSVRRVMKDETKKLLASLWTVEERATFETKAVREAFEDAGAAVHIMPSGLHIHFKGSSGYFYYTDKTHKTVGRPCGVGMFNIRRFLQG